MKAKTLSLLGLFGAIAACAAEPPPPPQPPPAPPPAPAPQLVAADDPAPTLRLPSDPIPTSESIVLHVDPREERFSGAVDIRVKAAKPHGVIWLSGRDMHVTQARVTPAGALPISATWSADAQTGVAKLALAETVPAGELVIHLEYDAPFQHGDRGLYKVTEAGVPYAYTQFESTSARWAFPCFDEPGFKIPFSTTLLVPKEMTAIANTHETSRERVGEAERVVFATTPPLPSYLVAFAVGQFDVVPAPDVAPNSVRKRPLPLRAVTPHGRGKDIAYALEHTGEILARLEEYFGIEYVYDKLDILAVPGKGGAMENPGAVTFGETLLLFDAKTASVRQRRGYASVMAHELAHQWTGDLVTMLWWDDTWLNEAFATWMAAKAADAWDPKLHTALSLLRNVQGAMGNDATMASRSIRQPIQSAGDIENAFDSITYQKGAAVLGMFERWAGEAAWQKGVHAYLEAHRFGNATADDFLEAEDAATGKGVKAAFHTFLDQPGVPLIEASVQCPKPGGGKASELARVHIAQSRFLPLGSKGDPHHKWDVPVCVSSMEGKPTGRTEECTLLSGEDGDVEIGAAGRCPTWVLPNAEAHGYYRFTLASPDLTKLRAHLDELSSRDKEAYANSLRAGFSKTTTLAPEVFKGMEPLARDKEPLVAEEPMGLIEQAHDWLFASPLRPKVEAYAAALYAPAWGRLGWAAKESDDDEARAMRGSVLGFLVSTGRDRALRAEAAKRGLSHLNWLLEKAGMAPLPSKEPVGKHPGGKDAAAAVAPKGQELDLNLVGAALQVVGEEADRATWDAMRALFSRSVDETVRGQLLWALGSAKDPTLIASARELISDPGLRETEVLTTLSAQLSQPDTQEGAWAYIKEHFEAIRERLPNKRRLAGVVGASRVFCDDDHAVDIQAFFAPKIDGIEGGKRVLASTVEGIELCAARRKVQEPAERGIFGKR